MIEYKGMKIYSSNSTDDVSNGSPFISLNDDGAYSPNSYLTIEGKPGKYKMSGPSNIHFPNLEAAKKAIDDFTRSQFMPRIIFNPVARVTHTLASGNTHWTITDDEVLARVQNNFCLAKPGYRKGVLEVPLSNLDGFFSPIVNLQKGDYIIGIVAPRYELTEADKKKGKKEEHPRKQTYVTGRDKSPAKQVTVILYSVETLMEDGGATVDAGGVPYADFEIVTILATPDDQPSPMTVGTLLANHFHMTGSNDGGTATGMTDQELVSKLYESHVYWKTRGKVAPEALGVILNEQVVDRVFRNFIDHEFASKNYFTARSSWKPVEALLRACFATFQERLDRSIATMFRSHYTADIANSAIESFNQQRKGHDTATALKTALHRAIGLFKEEQDKTKTEWQYNIVEICYELTFERKYGETVESLIWEDNTQKKFNWKAGKVNIGDGRDYLRLSSLGKAYKHALEWNCFPLFQYTPIEGKMVRIQLFKEDPNPQA